MDTKEKKDIVTFQLKVPKLLWNSFKIKAINNNETAHQTLMRLVEREVNV